MKKAYVWSAAKNARLVSERGVAFEDVVTHIENGDTAEISANKNQNDYPGQEMYAVKINDYIYLVPFEETDTEIILKTIFPSRKATKRLLGGRKHETR